MPKGIPVATVAIDGSLNAALLALRILATNDAALTDKLSRYKETMMRESREKTKNLV
jgi:phosphoribosylcarboxyaminoimidazole (NCAIR) mutase